MCTYSAILESVTKFQQDLNKLLSQVDDMNPEQAELALFLYTKCFVAWRVPLATLCWTHMRRMPGHVRDEIVIYFTDQSHPLKYTDSPAAELAVHRANAIIDRNIPTLTQAVKQCDTSRLTLLAGMRIITRAEQEFVRKLYAIKKETYARHVHIIGKDPEDAAMLLLQTTGDIKCHVTVVWVLELLLGCIRDIMQPQEMQTSEE